MTWLRIIRYFAYIFEGRLLVIIAENNVKIIIVCTMMITWIRLLPSKKFGQYWFLPSKNMMGYLKLRCFHWIFCHDNQLNQTKVCNTCSSFCRSFGQVVECGHSEWIYEVIVSPKTQTKNYKDFCPTIQTRIVALFFGDFLVSVGRFFWLQSLFVW